MKLFLDIRLSTHGGRIAAFDSKVTIMPTKNFGVFTSANGPAYSSYTFQEELHFLMHDLFFNETFSSQTLMDLYDAESFHNVPNETFIRVNVVNYIGVYGHLLFGNISISQDIEGKVLHVTSNVNFYTNTFM